MQRVRARSISAAHRATPLLRVSGDKRLKSRQSPRRARLREDKAVQQSFVCPLSFLARLTLEQIRRCGNRLSRQMQGPSRHAKLYWLTTGQLMGRSHHLITTSRRHVARRIPSAYWSITQAAGKYVALHAHARQCKVPPSRWLESAYLQ